MLPIIPDKPLRVFTQVLADNLFLVESNRIGVAIRRRHHIRTRTHAVAVNPVDHADIRSARHSLRKFLMWPNSNLEPTGLLGRRQGQCIVYTPQYPADLALARPESPRAELLGRIPPPEDRVPLT